jgi:hypothetical protein
MCFFSKQESRDAVGLGLPHFISFPFTVMSSARKDKVTNKLFPELQVGILLHMASVL